MVSLSFIVGFIGNIVSVLMFLAPVKTFWRIAKNKSTEEFESVPYICTLLSSSLWVYYGITKPGSYLVATVNGFGVVVQIIYISLFLLYAHPKMRRKTAILSGILDVGVLGVAILVTHFAVDGEMRIDVIGFFGAGLNIIMYGSPLAAMKRVAMTKSVEYMPFLLSFCFFLNGGIWTFYAVLVQDWFLGVPNGTGFALGTVQLILFAIYRPTKHKAADVEDGWQTDPLLSAPQHPVPSQD